MQRYIFVDLDDTLFQTRRKCPHDAATLEPRAYLRDGAPISYATPQQTWLWQWLNRDFRVIPVTARNYDAFRRVALPFAHEAILNHGAVVLDANQQLDRAWHAIVQRQLPAQRDALQTLWRDVERHCRDVPLLKPRLIHDFDELWYGVVKHSQGEEHALHELLQHVIAPHAAIAQGLLYWHSNGNNLALLPQAINKRHAVAYLLERYRRHGQPLLTLAMGDSHTDAAFMALCDYALIPRGTQLHQLLTPLAQTTG